MSSSVPERLLYTQDHEWVEIDGSTARVGITDFAQEALGDVVFVELPAVDQAVGAGYPLAEVESTKSVSEVNAPLMGTVVAINEQLRDSPDFLNSDPYGEGWICVLDYGDEPLAGLMNAAEYIIHTTEVQGDTQ